MAEMLEMKNITKSFGGVKANTDVSLRVPEGSVYSLLGENGAGKSTLMNVLYGLIEADSGEILIEGKQVEIRSPKDAIGYGIGMVHQHFMLIPALSVVENIILAMDETKGIFIDKASVTARVKELSDRYGFNIDPEAIVGDLSVGQQQRVEIVKAIYHNCRLLILDEPTAVLTPQETEELYLIIDQFRSENKSVIFISHKLHEVMHVSDEISVLRGGELKYTIRKEDTNEDELASYMVGKKVNFVVNKGEMRPGEVVLDAAGVTVRGHKGNIVVNDLGLRVRAGEIYGIAGVDGNGQTELAEVITGLREAEKGSIMILGKETLNHQPGEILSLGVSHIPEDRQKMAIMMRESLMTNMIIYDYKNPDYKKGPFIDWGKERKHAEDIITKYNIKAPGLLANIEYLSGGNQQKAVVARELEKSPKLLLAVDPTRGVDIGAIEFIHSEIVKARDAGCAVLLISSELDEIMALSDTIGVIYEGEIIGEMDRKDATIEKVGRYMAGMRDKESAGMGA